MRYARRPSLSSRLAFVTMVALPALAAAQGTGETAGFIVRLGSDTLAVERFTRDAHTLVGDLVLRSPRTRTVHYQAELTPSGGVSRMDLTTTLANAPNARPQRATITFSADTAIVEMHGRDSTRTMRVRAGPGALPLVQTVGFAAYELGVRQALAAHRDTMSIALVVPGNANPFATTFIRRGRDSVLIDFFGLYARAKIDAEGRILGLDGRGTTQKVMVERVPTVDVEALTAGFAGHDAMGQPMGTLSPRDTVRATIGGARLTIDYGRPAKRGREIFGGVEPWGGVWRTGANAATQLETSAPLVIAGKTIPAGKYTLWTLLDQHAPMLIVNRQTGQWGTEYRPDQDLVRVPLTLTRLTTAFELFTIAIEPNGDGGTLRMSWDTVAFTTPFAVGR
jgi:DUF2911 family protein